MREELAEAGRTYGVRFQYAEATLSEYLYSIDA